MARWSPDGADRLQQAALELFAEQSFHDVTVAAIATKAGLTERTFFRHFATKEDVLFTDGPVILEGILDAIRTAPKDASPRRLMEEVGDRLGQLFEHDRGYHRVRTQAIEASPALHERDLLKQSGWADAVAAELEARQLPKERAIVLAVTCTTVFRSVYRTWSTDDRPEALAKRLRSTLTFLADDLKQSDPTGS